MDKMFIRKDVYEELLEKGFGKKDYSKLTKKVITDKNGHKRTVFVKNDVEQTEQKQPKAQEGLSDEKRAKYEEMLEKVKAGSEENALFVRGEMLNKKDAIDYLEKKLGRKNGVIAEQKMKMEDEKKDTAMKDHETKSSEQMLDEKAKENFKKDARKMSDKGLEQKIKNLRTPGSLDNRVYSNPEEIAKVFEEELNRRKTKENDFEENYLDAKNEGGKDIADENRIDTHSKNAINLSDSEVKKMQKVFDYVPENATASQIMNTIYDEDKALYKKLSEMDIEYKKLHPEAEGKTFGFDLAAKYLEDSFNEYKKDHEVGKDKFAEMSVEDIRKEQQNLLDDYNQYYNAYKNGKNDGSKLREYFKKFDVYKTALDKKSKK